MREVVFLKNNQKKWRELESLMNNKQNASADQLADVFIELTDDLAYAQTYYPDSKLTLYLNDLTADLYRYIYKNKKEKGSRIITFWTKELPLEFYKARKVALFAFILFLTAAIIGGISSKQNPDFLSHWVGDLDSRIEDIQNDDPLAVYGRSDEGIMFFHIAWNNLVVSFFTFMGGIFLGLGSILFLFNNGLMLGSFQYLFIEYDKFWDSFLGIWIHGTIEITCIIIAGTAGLQMAKSILYPGTLSRSQSLMKGVKTAVKIFIGIIPLIILAAFLESYITNPRDFDLHWIARGLIISISGIFVVWYFIILPRIVSKRMGLSKPDPEADKVYGTTFIIFGLALQFLLRYIANVEDIDKSISFIAIPLIIYGIYRLRKGINQSKKIKELIFTN